MPGKTLPLPGSERGVDGGEEGDLACGACGEPALLLFVVQGDFPPAFFFVQNDKFRTLMQDEKDGSVAVEACPD